MLKQTPTVLIYPSLMINFELQEKLYGITISTKIIFFFSPSGQSNQRNFEPLPLSDSWTIFIFLFCTTIISE